MIKTIVNAQSKNTNGVELLYHAKNDYGGKEFYIYPNNTCGIMLLPHCIFRTMGTTILLTFDKSVKFSYFLLLPFNKPYKVSIGTNVEMISVAFSPHKFASFLDVDIDLVVDDYYVNRGLNKISEKVLNDVFHSELMMTTKLQEVESYFNSKYMDRIDYITESALRIIQNEPQISVKGLSERLNISVKSLIAKFHHQVGRTPGQFKKVVRFREALKYSKYCNSDAYQPMEYYDQSHMIREFHKYGGDSAKAILKKENISGQSQVLWLS